MASKHFGLLTSGGDCPGLNAVIRGVGKAGFEYDIRFTGFKDGFRGLAQGRSMQLKRDVLSGILTYGGTILGTSRDKPHRISIRDKTVDMTDAIVDTYERNHLDALVCIGGGGTQKNALRLKNLGLNIITIPKTIDNDVGLTDITVGFDTALGIATEAVDRLHSTATSHHRSIVLEVMGHRAGWLALGSGIAGGADVILIPEIPYNTEKVAQAILDRTHAGKRFSIVVVAEGSLSTKESEEINKLFSKKANAKDKSGKKKISEELRKFHEHHVDHTLQLTQELQKLTGIEARLTILGHLQRGGTPSAADRLLATRLGTTCVEYLMKGEYGIMLAVKNNSIEPVSLDEVAGNKKLVPPDHPLIQSARLVGTSFGD